MVARVACAAGPVLLACRQLEPLGLARRLPSRGAGAWRGAPLLPWRLQCPGCVCAALAAGSGGLGPVPGFVSSPFPPSRPAFPALCVSGHPVRVSLISLAGMPFHAVCAFRGLGLVALLVFPACPLCVLARAPPRRPPPPPGSMWRAHLARPRCLAPVGPFHAVRAPPRVLPWSRALFGLLGGGGGPVPFSPCLAWGRVPPLGRAGSSGAFRRRGAGGGRGLCAVLPGVAAGGPWGAGGRPTSVRPSAFPGQATKRVSLASLWSWMAWPPYCSGSRSRVVPGRGPCGAPVRWLGFTFLSRPVW